MGGKASIPLTEVQEFPPLNLPDLECEDFEDIEREDLFCFAVSTRDGKGKGKASKVVVNKKPLSGDTAHCVAQLKLFGFFYNKCVGTTCSDADLGKKDLYNAECAYAIIDRLYTANKNKDSIGILSTHAVLKYHWLSTFFLCVCNFACNPKDDSVVYLYAALRALPSQKKMRLELLPQIRNARCLLIHSLTKTGIPDVDGFAEKKRLAFDHAAADFEGNGCTREVHRTRMEAYETLSQYPRFWGNTEAVTERMAKEAADTLAAYEKELKGELDVFFKQKH